MEMRDDDAAIAPVTSGESDEVGETVVVDRSSAVEERTVVVDRSVAPEEHTVVVDRSAPVEERTVVVERSTLEERTVVVDRSAPVEERTVVVDRRRNRPRSGSVLGDIPRRRRHRELTPAPGGAQSSAVLASGPGAVTAYTPRAIPPPPSPAPEIALGPEATRADAPSMPSVAKSAHRTTLFAFGALAAAVVISVVGLIVIVQLIAAS